MIPTAQPTLPSQKRILFCACAGSEHIGDDKRQAVLSALESSGAEVTVVPDLCQMAAHQKEELAALASEDLEVVACFPRAVRSLLDWAGATEEAQAGVNVHNLRTKSSDEVLAELGLEPPAQDHPATAAPEREDDWEPWFPVIDMDRCTHCQQCVNFCLFGVYGRDENGQVRVDEPTACKTNCPACARVCPTAAIIFPKYQNSPINGDEVGDLAEEREKIRVDLDQVLGENVYAALAERRRKRKKLALLRQEGKTPS